MDGHPCFRIPFLTSIETGARAVLPQLGSYPWVISRETKAHNLERPGSASAAISVISSTCTLPPIDETLSQKERKQETSGGPNGERGGEGKVRG